MLGIPTINVFDALKVGIKLAVFGSFFSLFMRFLPDISALMVSTINKAFESFGVLDGLNLHCFAGLIGLDVFLNSVLNSVYIAGTFYISGVATLLTIRYTIQIASMILKI